MLVFKNHKKTLKMRKILLIVVLSIFSPSLCISAVIFSDGYDSVPSGWVCNDTLPTGYVSTSGCDSNTYDSTTHYAGEITSGGRTGNSLKLWRRNGIWGNYIGYLNKTLTSAEFANGYKELFVRWYMKIPPDWSFSAGEMKFNRFYTGTSAGDKSGSWRIGWVGNYLQFYRPDAPSGSNMFYSQRTVTQMGLNDGNWHSIEFHMRLNSAAGSQDGGFTFYVDGVEEAVRIKYGEENIFGAWGYDVGAATNEYFTSTLPPAIGNLTGGAETYTFPTNGWYAIEFDDYVVSTTYIGTVGNLSPSNGSCGSNDGGTFVNLTSGDTNNCSAGSVSGFTGTGPWYWTCTGSNGGADDNCSAEVTSSQQATAEILLETWEDNSTARWQYDFIQGDSYIDTDPVYAGDRAFKQMSSAPGNYVHFFGDHPQLQTPSDQVTDFVLEEYYYPQVGFSWPTTNMKLWLVNAFESWSAGYNLAEGQSKPHRWAPYYMTIAVDSSGQPFGQLTRADDLGGPGELWGNYWQNQGSPVSLTAGQWNKVKFRLKLNDAGQSNGIFQLWINDVLKADYSNMNYRGSYTERGWNHLMMSMHATPYHSQDQWIARDNISISSGEGSSGDSSPSVPQGFSRD